VLARDGFIEIPTRAVRDDLAEDAMKYCSYGIGHDSSQAYGGTSCKDIVPSTTRRGGNERVSQHWPASADSGPGLLVAAFVGTDSSLR